MSNRFASKLSPPNRSALSVWFYNHIARYVISAALTLIAVVILWIAAPALLAAIITVAVEHAPRAGR